LLRVDLKNGNREQISGPERGAGPALLLPLAVILEHNPERANALVLDGGDYSTDSAAKLVRVDLESGDRTIVSDDVHGEGPTLSGPRALAMDTSRGRVLVTCSRPEVGGIYAIDLDSGDRSVVSSASRGSGPEISFATEIVADALSDRAFVVDSHQLFAVDLNNGDRTEVLHSRDLLGGIVLDPSGEHLIVLSLTANGVLSIDSNDFMQELISGGQTFAAGMGSGAALIFPRGIALDGGANVAYVGDQYRSAVFAIDMLSGDRVILSR
jgi:DNA-binding beta-propeller fold protein YncE